VIKHELRINSTASETSQLSHGIGKIIFQNNFVLAEKIQVEIEACFIIYNHDTVMIFLCVFLMNYSRVSKIFSK
jgi:hypothetical protein